MALPTFLTIPAGELVPGAPALAEHPVKIQDQAGNNRGRIGGSYTEVEDHNHDGVNSAPIDLSGGAGEIDGRTQIAVNSVPVGRLALAAATAGGTYGFAAWSPSAPSGVTFSLGNQVQHRPICTMSGAGGYWLVSDHTFTNPAYGPSTNVSFSVLAATGTYSVSVVGYYHSASPPWDLPGGLRWSDFVYLIRRKSDGAVMFWWISPDPVWAPGEAREILVYPKDHPIHIARTPHPFLAMEGVDLDRHRNPGREYEVVMVDTRALGCDQVAFNPYLYQLELQRSARLEMIRQGCSPEELDAHEERVQQSADEYEVASSKHRSRLDSWDLEAETEEAYLDRELQRLALSSSKSDLVRRNFRRLQRRKHRELRVQSGRLCTAEVLQVKSHLYGMDRCFDLYRDLPCIREATQSISEDPSHPDHKHLNRLPGVLTRSAGQAPRIRVVTRP